MSNIPALSGLEAVQGYPWLHSDFEASLGYTDPIVSNNKDKTDISLGLPTALVETL